MLLLRFGIIVFILMVTLTFDWIICEQWYAFINEVNEILFVR